jgi:hypothetical protein
MMAPIMRRVRFDDLPLFASDSELGPAVLGEESDRWRAIAAIYEHRGLRYTPAVKAFFDNMFGRAKHGPFPRDGEESWPARKPTTSKRRAERI